MPVKGADKVRENYKSLVGKISGQITEEAMTRILIVGQSNAANLTPTDTSNLINSQFREVRRVGDRTIGTVGYTASYAIYVHEAKGVLLGTGTPRNSSDPGRGNVWDPNGAPEFLLKGFERDGMEEIKKIIREAYRV